MNDQERQEFEQMKDTVRELQDFIERYFNPDGTPKNLILTIEAEDEVTTPAGSIRVITNKGPKNILIA